MKSKRLKILTSLLLLLSLCKFLLGAGYNDDGLDTSLSDDLGDLISVFDLKYGNSIKITYNGEEIELSITDVDNSVNVDCSLTDFSNNVDGPLAVKVYSHLQINNQDKIVKIASKPCGALFYENNGHDIQDVNELIDALESAPANLKDSSYFVDTFINLFGEGTLIQNTPFRIFMTKASPTNYNLPDANIEDYQFIFIVTAK